MIEYTTSPLYHVALPYHTWEYTSLNKGHPQTFTASGHSSVSPQTSCGPSARGTNHHITIPGMRLSLNFPSQYCCQDLTQNYTLWLTPPKKSWRYQGQPSGAGSNPFRDLTNSKCLYPGLSHEDMQQGIISVSSDTGEYHIHAFFILSNQMQVAQNLVLNLILALQNQQAAPALPCSNVSGPLSSDLPRYIPEYLQQRWISNLPQCC
jgi:hypothetical protein